MKSIIAALLIVVGLASLSYADDASKGGFKISQFPSDGWDQKNIGFAIYIEYPSMQGRTSEEAEKIRKFFVTQSVRRGIEFLFRLATYDSTLLSFDYSMDNCKNADQLPTAPVSPAPLESARKRLLAQCSSGAGRTGPRKGAQIQPDAYDDRDIGGKSYGDVLAFGDFVAKNHLPFSTQPGQRDDRFVEMDASENRNAISSYLLASKDKQGQEVRVLNVTIPTALAATGTGQDENNFDIPASQGLYRNVVNMPQGYLDVDYRHYGDAGGYTGKGAFQTSFGLRLGF